MTAMRSTWLCLVGLIGCGSVDTLEPRPSGQGGGGASGAAVSSTSSSSGGSCTKSAQCPSGSWCTTLGCNAPGTCVPLPTGCTDDCPGVCGCNDVTYCNACEAANAGFDVSVDEPCEGIASYRAVAWYGGLDHLILMKANVSDAICIRIYADAPTTSSLSIEMPEPWAVSQIHGAPLTADCLDETVPLSDPSSLEGVGTILWRGSPTIPCELTADVTIFLNSGFNPPELFQATLAVEGCE